MTEAGFGRINNLSSVSALENRGQANYVAAKAGLQGFTKTVALELEKLGVTANAVAPSFIETEMTAATEARMEMKFDELKTRAAADIPVARVGVPDDNAHGCQFLPAKAPDSSPDRFSTSPEDTAAYPAITPSDLGID